MFINIYDEETRGLIRKTNGTETLYFFVLNCLRNQPDLSFSEQQVLANCYCYCYADPQKDLNTF